MLENFETIKEAASTAFKDGVEKVTAGLNEASTQNQANLDAVVKSSQIFGKGMGEVAALASQYTKAAFERGVEAAKTIGATKSLQDLVEIQAEYAKTSVSSFLADFNKIAEVVANTGTEAAKPVSTRTTEIMSKFQAAAE